MVAVNECVLCTRSVHKLNEMYEIFGVSHLHVCYECLCLKCVQTTPPMDMDLF